MSQGDVLQNYNQQLVKCIKDMREKKENVTKEISTLEGKKLQLTKEIATLNEQLSAVEETLVENKKSKEKFYYTAWCKEDLRSLLDIEEQHIPYINMLSNALKTEYHINDKNSRQLINFPPDFWRLHIHFISTKYYKNIRCNVLRVHYLRKVLHNIRSNEEFYRERVFIQR